MPPEDADFAFKIDFKRGEGNPRRVFAAASALIEAFETLDQALAPTIDGSLRPALVLEDVETGSLKVWLKQILLSVDDEAIKKLDWKSLVGAYLIRAKYVVISYCDSGAYGEQLPPISNLGEQLRKLAEQTDVRHLPAYPPIHEAKLIKAISDIQDAKQHLGRGDRLTIETEDLVYEVNLDSIGLPLIAAKVDVARESQSEGEMILTVRKPDLLRDSMWQFVHGKSPVAAAILDEGWLQRFHNREVPIFPGDALRCRVRFTYSYDAKNELSSIKTEILIVIECISGKPPEQQTLF